MMESPE